MPVNRVPIREIEGGILAGEGRAVSEYDDPLLAVAGVTEANVEAVRAVLESESEDKESDLKGIDGIGDVTAQRIIEASR